MRRFAGKTNCWERKDTYYQLFVPHKILIILSPVFSELSLKNGWREICTLKKYDIVTKTYITCLLSLGLHYYFQIFSEVNLFHPSPLETPDPPDKRTLHRLQQTRPHRDHNFHCNDEVCQVASNCQDPIRRWVHGIPAQVCPVGWRRCLEWYLVWQAIASGPVPIASAVAFRGLTQTNTDVRDNSIFYV